MTYKQPYNVLKSIFYFTHKHKQVIQGLLIHDIDELFGLMLSVTPCEKVPQIVNN
jgi:hypothetical protein